MVGKFKAMGHVAYENLFSDVATALTNGEMKPVDLEYAPVKPVGHEDEEKLAEIEKQIMDLKNTMKAAQAANDIESADVARAQAKELKRKRKC